jgi:YxiJ-like protein
MSECMNNEANEQLIDAILRRLEEKRQHPFPYDGCRKILRESDNRYENLIPDLDIYFSDIAGYCSWGKKILDWPKEKIQEAKERLEEDFFEKYPKYKPLEPMLTETNVPDLHAELALYETMRTKLLQLLTRLSEIKK